MYDAKKIYILRFLNSYTTVPKSDVTQIANPIILLFCVEFKQNIWYTISYKFNLKEGA